jgi:hypothetical protein
VLSLQVVGLSGHRFIVLPPDLLFCCARSSLTRYIWSQAGHIWPIPDISGLPSFNQFKSSEFQVCLPIHPPPPLGNFQVASRRSLGEDEAEREAGACGCGVIPGAAETRAEVVQFGRDEEQR